MNCVCNIEAAQKQTRASSARFTQALRGGTETRRANYQRGLMRNE